MADNFDELDGDPRVQVDEDVLAMKIEYDKIFLNCMNTAEGKRMVDTLRARLVDVPIYVKGDTLEATSYRQGMADVVKMIDKCVEYALMPPTPNGR